MEEQAPDVRFGMPLEAAQTLHDALSKALDAHVGTDQTVSVSIRRETVERFQALQTQNSLSASAVIFITQPKEESAETEQEGEESGEEEA